MEIFITLLILLFSIILHEYSHGYIAYKNGDILFPMIFQNIRWFGEKEAALAELGGKTYILTVRGGIFDPEKYKKEQETEKGN